MLQLVMRTSSMVCSALAAGAAPCWLCAAACTVPCTTPYRRMPSSSQVQCVLCRCAAPLAAEGHAQGRWQLGFVRTKVASAASLCFLPYFLAPAGACATFFAKELESNGPVGPQAASTSALAAAMRPSAEGAGAGAPT